MRNNRLRGRHTRRNVCIVAAAALLVGIPAAAHLDGSGSGRHGSISLSNASLTVTNPRLGVPLGVFKRKDKHLYAAVLGTTTGSTPPTATYANRATPPAPTPPVVTPSTAPTGSATPTPTPTPTVAPPTLPAATLPAPAGVFPATGARTYAEPVDLTPYIGTASPTSAQIRVADGTGATTTVTTPLYSQTVTAVRVKTASIANGNVVITATATDQYGQPVVGAPVRLAGSVSGTKGPRVNQLGITDALGQVTYRGPGTGTGPAVATGYPNGFYTAYFDHDVDGRRGGQEPEVEVIRGIVSLAAPGKAFYHNDARIKNAGGVYADAKKGTLAAHAKHYTWIDQDGQLSFRTRAHKVAGAGRVASPTDLVWVNAHGSPFNPKWLKKGRFETHVWNKIRHRSGLRDVAKTLKQDAKYGLSVEWEVKDVQPFTTDAALNAAFSNLATTAQRYYGAAWRSRVQIKVLSNLSGGQAYALNVLKHAHAYGFTTMLLARGKATRTQIPADAQSYVNYVRGANAGDYAYIPSSTQNAPVRVVTPPMSAAL